MDVSQSGGSEEDGKIFKKDDQVFVEETDIDKKSDL